VTNKYTFAYRVCVYLPVCQFIRPSILSVTDIYALYSIWPSFVKTGKNV